MEALTKRLYDLLNLQPLRKKLLLVNRHAEGLQLLERVVRKYGPVLNVEVETIESIVRRQASAGLFAAGKTFVQAADAFWTVREIMVRLAEESSDPYVPSSMATPGVVRSFHQALRELRSAGLTANTLDAGAFESLRKGDYVRSLLGRYEQALSARGWVDAAAALSYVEALPVRTTLVLAPHLQAGGAEKLALERLSPSHVAIVEPERAFTDPYGNFPTCRAEMFHATGTLAEVREAFRRMSAAGVKADEIEIVASDYTSYAQSIHTQAELYGLPCTYSGGLPIEFSAVGRAALLVVDWIESNYRLDLLTGGIAQGWIRMEGIPRSRLIRALDASGIGWSRSRYMDWVERSRGESDETDEAEEYKALRRFFRTVFAALPDGASCSPLRILEGIVAVTEDYAAKPNEEEALVWLALKDACDAMRRNASPVMELPLAIRYARDAIGAVSFNANSRPRPGHVHVSSLQDGGTSGRAYTIVVGMSEQAWSVSASQDAVLLDEERTAISPSLPLSSHKAKDAWEERLSRIGTVEGACTLSFSSYDLSENKEVHPAYELLQVYRNRTGSEDADFDALMRGMPAIRGYAAPGETIPLDATDAWLAELITGRYRIRYAGAGLLEAYPHLAEGQKALAARFGELLSAYEGMVDTSAYPIDYTGESEAQLSVSKLEQFAQCPLQFYYRQVLGVRPKEKAEFDRSAWLDPLQRGRLLHEVFQRYYEELRQAARGPIHDRELLERVTDQTLEHYQAEVPSPSRHIFEKECASIRADVEIFYRTEQELGQIPAYMELPLHSEEGALQVELGEELTIPVKGIVDRIDEIAPHEYRIYDYKTGNPRKYKQAGYFAGGTQLQHALYAVAVEQWLAKQGADAQARVAEAAYYFPTERGMGELVTRIQNRREELKTIIGNMVRAMGEGAFPPTHEPRICQWCDYQAACGKLAETSLEKRDLETNRERLKRIAEVIAHE